VPRLRGLLLHVINVLIGIADLHLLVGGRLAVALQNELLHRIVQVRLRVAPVQEVVLVSVHLQIHNAIL